MIIDRQDFNPLIGQVYHTCMLPPEQMKEISRLMHTRDRTVIGVQYCEKAKVVKFLMGNQATISVPCEMFPREDKNGEVINFNFPFVEDYGFNISFGDYEADLRAVLLI